MRSRGIHHEGFSAGRGRWPPAKGSACATVVTPSTVKSEILCKLVPYSWDGPGDRIECEAS